METGQIGAKGDAAYWRRVNDFGRYVAGIADAKLYDNTPEKLLVRGRLIPPERKLEYRLEMARLWAGMPSGLQGHEMDMVVETFLDDFLSRGSRMGGIGREDEAKARIRKALGRWADREAQNGPQRDESSKAMPLHGSASASPTESPRGIVGDVVQNVPKARSDVPKTGTSVPMNVPKHVPKTGTSVPICSVNGCPKPSRARGMCRSHYRRAIYAEKKAGAFKARK